MRITQHEQDVIKKVIGRFVPKADVYVFGSRVNDYGRGGDIDILIVGETKIDLGVIVKIQVNLDEIIGEQKIDILYQQKDNLTPFAQIAKMEGILL